MSKSSHFNLFIALPLMMLAPLPAFARDPNCAGGIQYVIQALKDKQKGNMDDYAREIGKAIDRLEKGIGADPKDFEAQGYLAWAYAENGNFEKAGLNFNAATTGIKSQGVTGKNKGIFEIITNNQESYRVVQYNDGVKSVNEGEASYEKAAQSFNNARLINPAQVESIKSLASAYARMQKYDDAEKTIAQGLVDAAQDARVLELQEVLKTIHAGHASALIEAKKYDEAIQLLQGSTDRAALGNAYFLRADSQTDAKKKQADFNSAGEQYALAAETDKTNKDNAYNAALAFENAGNFDLASQYWALKLKVDPNSDDATTAIAHLATTLAAQKKYAEAVENLNDVIDRDEKQKNLAQLFQSLAAVYQTAGQSAQSGQYRILYLAYHLGVLAESSSNEVKESPASSSAGSVAGSLGIPDQVLNWTVDSQKYTTWVYRLKRTAFTFDKSGGYKLSQKTVYGDKFVAEAAKPAPKPPVKKKPGKKRK